MDKQSSWASSVEAQNLHFLTNSLRPLLVNIEQEITRCLIGEADADEFFAEFAVEGCCAPTAPPVRLGTTLHCRTAG